MVEDKGAKTKEKPDLKIGKAKYKSDLIPPSLVVARYFPKEQAALEDLGAKAETLCQEVETFVEENGGEEGLLSEVINDKGKAPKAEAEKRLAAIRRDPDAADERKALEDWGQTGGAKCIRNRFRRNSLFRRRPNHGSWFGFDFQRLLR